MVNHLSISRPLDKGGGSIGHSRFICQVWCSGIQGIYSGLSGGSISQSRFAKFGVVIFKASMLNSLGGHLQSMLIYQVLSTGIQGKYHLSELKFLIVIWGVFQGGYI